MKEQVKQNSQNGPGTDPIPKRNDLNELIFWVTSAGLLLVIFVLLREWGLTNFAVRSIVGMVIWTIWIEFIRPGTLRRFLRR